MFDAFTTVTAKATAGVSAGLDTVQGGTKFAFQITTRDPDRIWLLKASSEEELNKWINACIIHSKYYEVSASNSNNQTKNPKAAAMYKEGVLEKLAGGVSGKVATLTKGITWRSRWFVLKDGLLFKYEHKNDPKPTKIALYQCTLEEYRTDPDEEICTQFQIATKQKSIILKAASEEEMHAWLNAVLKQKLMVEQVIDDIQI